MEFDICIGTYFLLTYVLQRCLQYLQLLIYFLFNTSSENKNNTTWQIKEYFEKFVFTICIFIIFKNNLREFWTNSRKLKYRLIYAI